MTERERYLTTLLFGCPDRIPLMPGGAEVNPRALVHRGPAS